jgi:hypothetical protein
MKHVLAFICSTFLFYGSAFAGGSEVTNPWPWNFAKSPSTSLAQAFRNASIDAFQSATVNTPITVDKVSCTQTSFTAKSDFNCDVTIADADTHLTTAFAQGIFQGLLKLGAHGTVENPEFYVVTVTNLTCVLNDSNDNWTCSF